MGRDRASRPEAKPLRLFVAVDLSPEACEAIEATLGPWRERLPARRWIPRENWHVTLKFLGRTWPRLVPEVERVCGEAAEAVDPFEVGLDGLGVFPSPGRARVLWVGLEDPDQGLDRLDRGLEEGLAEWFEPGKRPYRPHLTVARFNPPAPLREHAEPLAATRIQARPSRVDRLVLYRSHLHPRGARYEALAAYPLAAPGT